jgi:hypothetical protein
MKVQTNNRADQLELPPPNAIKKEKKGKVPSQLEYSII